MVILNLNIDSLALTITNAHGHEHRIRPIAARAVAIFAERVDVYYRESPQTTESKHLNDVSAKPVDVDLGKMTNEDAAQTIARSWLQSLTLKLI